MSKSMSLVLLSLALMSTQIASATTPPTRVVSANFFDIANPFSGPLLSSTYAGVPPSQYSVPTDIRVNNWNNLPLQFLAVPGSNIDLVDSQGFFTSVDVDWIATDVQSGQTWAQGILSGDSGMMNGSIQSTIKAPTNRIDINVHELANTFDLGSGYDVIIYADQDGPHGGGPLARQSFFVDDGITLGAAITLADTVNNGNGRAFEPALDYDEGTFDGAGTWIRFSGLTGPSFTIEALAIGSSPAFINGFQIVGYEPVNVPPSGDLDGDSIVAGIDFLEWQRGFSSGIYTHVELAEWQANYGAGSPILGPSVATNAVPEPTTLWLGTLAATIAVTTTRRKRLR
ncbi:MAG: hypothetical protein ACR2NM_00695 [Bythopirellula sp.]